MAFFVALEGMEGSGKTTQARLLYEQMVAHQHRVVLAYEPGVTALGDYLRSWLKQNSTTPHAELFLFCAARAQLVTEVVKPSLADGVHVVTDRYSASTVAYQGHGRGLGEEVVRPAIDLATQGVEPDLYVLLDIDPQMALGRIAVGSNASPSGAQEEQVGNSRVDTEGQRFEEEPLEFHRRVRRGYLGLAEANPETWLVLDATRSAKELAGLIWGKIAALLSENRRVS